MLSAVQTLAEIFKAAEGIWMLRSHFLILITLTCHADQEELASAGNFLVPRNDEQ